ncbi:hypothetical protein ACFWUP_08420 [Nocardia sp. NPDC058658]|uniref:hypothetical protein n=1 Tax=Nocardia sp. NPDC058658 TaxID=3346580 RepID=UPI00365F4D20
MNHAEHDESIGSMLASIATALREVSDKLDIVAARVQLDVPTFPADEDVPDHIRIRRLESWAFRASQDISRLSSRLDALDSDGEPDSGRPVRSTPSRREVREAAEAAERAADGPDDQLSAADPLPPHQNRDADGARPPLERRTSPARPSTDHLGDPTALAATPIPRTAPSEAPFGQPIAFDTDMFADVGDSDAEPQAPSRRPAPARLSGAAANGAGERVSVGTATSTNGSGGSGVAGDIASSRNGAAVPAVIGTVLTAPADDQASGTSATKPAAAALREPESGLANAADSATLPRTSSTAGSATLPGTSSTADGATLPGSASVIGASTLPGSADVRTVVREGDVRISGVNGSGATKQVPAEAQSARAEANVGDSVAAGIGANPSVPAGMGPDAVVERARPVKKPSESSGDRLDAPSPDALSGKGHGVAANPTRPENDHLSSGFTTGGRPSTAPNGKPINGFGPHTPDVTRSDSAADAQPAGNTANGIHWSFSEDPAPSSTTPDRNGHARNGFTTDSAHRNDSLFGDFTPRDRLTTGETPESAVSTPPARLTPPSELTQPNRVPDSTPEVGSSHVNGSSDSPRPSTDRPANTGRLPGQPPLTNPATTDHERPAVDFDPPTLGLPTGRASSTDPLERPATDPAPPTATDSAGITVTGTYRAFDIERAHVDKLQAMLDELKRSAGLPPGRRDVFGPPTPDLG